MRNRLGRDVADQRALVLLDIIADCAAMGMGVLAIRVFAGGALLGNPPSAHTFKTPFFPLALYERDRERAARLLERIGPRVSVKELALRFAVSHPNIHAEIVGFGAPEHVNEVVDLIDESSRR